VTGILIAFLVVLVVPLFVGTWRTSFLGLSLQGFLLSWIAFRHGVHFSAELVVEVVDLVVLRAIAAPWLLRRVLTQQNAPARNHVLAPNLFSWAIALALALMAFLAADQLVPVEGDAQLLVAVSTAALLLGLLVLATRGGHLSQMIGALRIENAIALFELGSVKHPSLGIRIGQVLITAGSIAFYRWYLQHLAPDESLPALTPDSQRATS
jgi:hydrogenase-4 component E